MSLGVFVTYVLERTRPSGGGRGRLGLLSTKSEEMAVGSDVHQIFHEGWCGGNFLADDVSSQDFQFFGVGIDDHDRAGV